MIGALRRVHKTCNTEESYILAVLELIWEWLRKDYRVQWIVKAIRKALIICDDVILENLRGLIPAQKFRSA